MIICGFQKLTLLDFPSHTACTVFTGGCNMRCPFCHNASLVTGNMPEKIEKEEIFSFLKKRQGLLDGVAITGGEPLLQKDIVEFIKEVRALSFKVKLDTNGCYPEKLEEILSENLVDYVAMDIKNSKEKYSLTAGVEIDFEKIKKSVELLKKSNIEREFRTTVTKELHTEDDIISIAKFLGEGEKYYLQMFKDSGEILSLGISAPADETLKSMSKKAKEITGFCETRGI